MAKVNIPYYGRLYYLTENLRKEYPTFEVPDDFLAEYQEMRTRILAMNERIQALLEERNLG